MKIAGGVTYTYVYDGSGIIEEPSGPQACKEEAVGIRIARRESAPRHGRGHAAGVRSRGGQRGPGQALQFRLCHYNA